MGGYSVIIPGFYPKPNIYICYTCVGATALLLVIWAFTMDIKWEQAEQLRRAKLELAMKKNDEGEVDEERDMTLLESSGGEERKEVEVSDEEQTSADSESEDGDENDPVPSPVQTRSRRLSASRNEIVKPKEDEPAVRRRRTKVLASRNEDPEEDRVSFRTRSSSRTRR
uniref:Uncharacterized protein n=1 Tax=Caenorhabditis japonica TaxID=281687 RepID=A0A8R1I964_CAEJA